MPAQKALANQYPELNLRITSDRGPTGTTIHGRLEVQTASRLAERPEEARIAILNAAAYALASEFERLNAERTRGIRVDALGYLLVLEVPRTLTPEPIVAQLENIASGRLAIAILSHSS
jgi:hypothetical protein